MVVENAQGELIEPSLDRPKKIAIVALGASCRSFVLETLSKQGLSYYDEVWTVNRGFRGIRHDRLFVMDDFKWIAERDPAYAEFLKKHDKPIMTSTVYADYPQAVAYPLQAVMETIGDDAFAVNTVAYMIAYAMHIGVKEMSIYGADFVYPNGNTAEFGGQACTYLLGMCRHFDIQFRLPGDTTLLYANKVKPLPGGGMGREPYGYHRKREMEEKEKKNGA